MSLAGPHAAFEDGVGLVLDGLRQGGPGGGFDLGEAGRGGLLHQAVRRGLLRAVTLVADRRTSRLPVRLLNRTGKLTL